MVLRVSGKNLDIGTALREHVETRVAALAERYVTGLISGTVTFGQMGRVTEPIAICASHRV